MGKQHDDAKEEEVLYRPRLPETRIQYFFWKIRLFIVSFWMHWKRRLMIGGILFLASFVLNFYGLAYINDSNIFGRTGRSGGGILAYVFAGQARPYNSYGVYGFDDPFMNLLRMRFTNLAGTYIDTTIYVYPLMYAVMGIGAVLLSNLKREKWRIVLQPLDAIKIYRESKQYSIKGARQVVIRGMFSAVLISYFIKNPLAIPLLGIYHLLLFASGEGNYFAWKHFVKKRACTKDKSRIIMADSFLYGLGKAYGYLLSALLALLNWKAFHYSFPARTSFTVIALVFLLLFGTGRINLKKKAAANTAGAGVLLFGILAMACCRMVLADDGGIGESGSFLGLIKNEGFWTSVWESAKAGFFPWLLYQTLGTYGGTLAQFAYDTTMYVQEYYRTHPEMVEIDRQAMVTAMDDTLREVSTGTTADGEFSPLGVAAAAGMTAATGGAAAPFLLGTGAAYNFNDQVATGKPLDEAAANVAGATATDYLTSQGIGKATGKLPVSGMGGDFFKETTGGVLGAGLNQGAKDIEGAVTGKPSDKTRTPSEHAGNAVEGVYKQVKEAFKLGGEAWNEMKQTLDALKNPDKEALKMYGPRLGQPNNSGNKK